MTKTSETRCHIIETYAFATQHFHISTSTLSERVSGFPMTLKLTLTPNLNKRLCYCSGTTWRATSVEIWPFLTDLLKTESRRFGTYRRNTPMKLKTTKMTFNMSPVVMPFDRPHTFSY